MAQYTAPGVYVEEISSGSAPIAGVSTSVAGFIGLVSNNVTMPKKPDQSGDYELAQANEPQLITSWPEFKKKFGDFDAGNKILAHAVYGFFNNGGSRCWVVRTQNALNTEDVKKALTKFDEIDEIGLVTVPGEVEQSIQKAVIDHCENMKDRFAILDGKQKRLNSQEKITDAGTSNYAALYFPWIKVYNSVKVNEIRKAKEALEAAERAAKAGETPKTKTQEALAITAQKAQEAKNTADQEYQEAEIAYKKAQEATEKAQEVFGDANALTQKYKKEAEKAKKAEKEKKEEKAQRAEEAETAAQQAFEDAKNAETAAEQAFEDAKNAETAAQQAFKDAKKAQNKVNTQQPADSAQNGVQEAQEALKKAKELSDQIFVPPSGHIAGLYARVDAERGIHKAPANEVIRGALGLKYRISRNQQGELNREGINIIREFNGNVKVWGARTLGGDGNTEWKYISVRRLFIYLRQSIEEGTQWAVFEPNGPDLWAKIRRNITAFLTTVWRDGMLFGDTPEQAFFVRCDENTNPPELRDLGQVVTEIGVSVLKPAEFVIFRISQWNESGG